MIIFLYGEDEFRSRQKLNTLKEKFIREVDPAGNSIVNIDGESTDMGEVGNSIGPSSLFSRRRLVIIENIFSNKKNELFAQLIQYLENNQHSDNIVIFRDASDGKSLGTGKGKKELFAFLERQKFAEAFPLLSDSKAADWVRQEAESRGGRISHQAASALVGLLSGDLWQLSNEIDKLIMYKKSQPGNNSDQAQPIEVSDIKDLVRGKLSENIFALTDAISNKNRVLAIKLLDDQIQAGLAENYVLTMIIRQFRILLSIREALDQGYTSRKIISSLKLHPFVVQKGLTQVRNFSSVFLKRAYSHLLQIDYLAKTGQADLRTSLDVMMAKI